MFMVLEPTVVVIIIKTLVITISHLVHSILKVQILVQLINFYLLQPLQFLILLTKMTTEPLLYLEL